MTYSYLPLFLSSSAHLLATPGSYQSTVINPQTILPQLFPKTLTNLPMYYYLLGRDGREGQTGATGVRGNTGFKGDRGRDGKDGNVGTG